MTNRLGLGFALLLFILAGCNSGTEQQRCYNQTFRVGNESYSGRDFAEKYMELSNENIKIKKNLSESINKTFTEKCMQNELEHWYWEKFPSLHPRSSIDYKIVSFGSSSTISIDFPKGTEVDYLTIECQTDSMSPTLICNDKVIGYKPKSIDDIIIGDIIAFKNRDYLDIYGKDILIVHRVIAEYDGKFMTSGDNIAGLYPPLNGLVTKDKTDVHFEDIELKIIGVLYGKQ